MAMQMPYEIQVAWLEDSDWETEAYFRRKDQAVKYAEDLAIGKNPWYVRVIDTRDRESVAEFAS